MIKQTHTNLLSPTKLLLVVVLAVWSPLQMRSAEPAEGKSMMEGKMMESCQKMKEQKQKFMTEMKAQDTELAAQVTQMNSAPEDKKLGLVAAVVTQMVEQRATMNARRGKMEDEMMAHMMQHMQMGKESMSGCPMMKDMKEMKNMEGMEGMAETSASAHKDHP